MKTSSLKLLLLISAFAPHADAGKFRDFCEKYIIADDPDDAGELLQELRELYPQDRFQFVKALRSIYISEIAKLQPNERLLSVIEQELVQ